MPGPRSYILEDTDGDGRFGEGDDLRDDVKETLADYLSGLTRTPPTQNAYPLEAGERRAPSFNEVTDRTPAIVTGGNSVAPKFISDVTQVAKAYLESIGDGDFGDGDDPLLGLIDKTLRAAKHGELLGTIEGDGSSKVEEKISEVLLNNRFNPSGNTYIKDGDYSASDGGSSTFGRTQKLMGEYVADDGDDAQPYSVDDLQKIASSLLLIGTGRLQADDNPDVEDSGTILTTTGGEGIQLATVRIGNEKLGAGDLEARNVYGGAKLTKNKTINARLRDPEIPAKAGFFDFDTPGASYGQMFSHLEMFAPMGAYSPSPISLLLPQFITIAASTAAVGLIISLLTGDLGFAPKEHVDAGRDVLPMGKNKKTMGMLGGFGAMMKRLMNIPETEAALLPSIFVGLLWFQVASLFGGAGFVVSVQRSVARDTVAFMDQLANDDLFSGGFISDLGAIGIIINSLLSSKFFRFTVTMAVLGDKIITGHWKKRQTNNGGLGWKSIDEAPNNALYRVAKSRKYKDRKGLVWNTGNVPSTYVLPAAFVAASLAGPQVDAGGALAGFLSNASLNAKLVDPATFNDINGEPGSRLPGDLVEMIENQLEVEYVPFYFHDLRTNEIIAFHAFIQNISDSYAANWNPQTGIGRVEPAYIYGGTTRSIGMQFLIAATGPDDYDEMWYKINKLTTLIYPQFSRGRVLINEELKFVQPFSQVQTASPLVRIRLGDLFKSNYSKFSLARLFGLGQGDGVFQPDSTGVEAVIDPEIARKYLDAFEKVYDTRNVESENFIGYTVGDQVTISAGQRLNVSPIIPHTGKQKNNMMLDVDFHGTVTLPGLLAPPGDDGSAGSAAQVAAMGTPAAGAGAGAEPPELPINIKYLVMLDTDANDLLNKQFDPTVPGAYQVTVSHEALELQRSWADALASVMAGIIPDPFAPPPEKLGEFLDATNNAIVRSFESSRGRGLAGAITSMDFDWNEKTWVTERVGSKAPMFCSVTLQFNPIHDITPGLDSDGFNRAPIYNVGKVMNAIGGDPYDITEKNEAVTTETLLQKTTIGTSVQGLVTRAKGE